MIITLHSLDNEMLKTETMKYIQSQNLILFNLSNAATCNYKECKLVSHCGTNFYKHIYYTLDSTFVRHTCGICLFSITLVKCLIMVMTIWRWRWRRRLVKCVINVTVVLLRGILLCFFEQSFRLDSKIKPNKFLSLRRPSRSPAAS